MDEHLHSKPRSEQALIGDLTHLEERFQLYHIIISFHAYLLALFHPRQQVTIAVNEHDVDIVKHLSLLKHEQPPYLFRLSTLVLRVRFIQIIIEISSIPDHDLRQRHHRLPLFRENLLD